MLSYYEFHLKSSSLSVNNFGSSKPVIVNGGASTPNSQEGGRFSVALQFQQDSKNIERELLLVLGAKGG